MAEAKMWMLRYLGSIFFFLIFLKKNGIHDNAMGIFFSLILQIKKFRNILWVLTPKYKST